jgi:hypothetical protein
MTTRLNIICGLYNIFTYKLVHSSLGNRQSRLYTALYTTIGVLKVEVPRICRQSAHEGDKVISPKQRPPLPSPHPKKGPLHSFLLEAEVKSGPEQKKNSNDYIGKRNHYDQLYFYVLDMKTTLISFDSTLNHFKIYFLPLRHHPPSLVYYCLSILVFKLCSTLSDKSYSVLGYHKPQHRVETLQSGYLPCPHFPPPSTERSFLMAGVPWACLFGISRLPVIPT